MLNVQYLKFYNHILKIIPAERIFTDELKTLAYGTDAGFYRLIPQIVIKAETEEEIVSILQYSKELKVPVTFRAAGTSLSGQSISDSILVMLGSNWTKYKIIHDAAQITLQPGMTGGNANLILAPYAKKIGPDPASINSAMIGGIASNNASGMCCGTAQNSYRTLFGIKVIFVDGTILDTSDNQSREGFLRVRKDLVDGVLRIRDSIFKNEQLADRIRQKYKMKNTTGYSLNAFVDFADPIDIISHLMIGSEGTLGFISEITFNTVPELKDKASSLMIFPSIEIACKAIGILKKTSVDAVELMDRAALHSVEDKKGMPGYLKALDENAAALLVETRAVTSENLKAQINEIVNSLSPLPKVYDIVFTDNTSEFTMLWNIRKGLFPSVGSMRETGTTCIIEDVAFPVNRLAEATLDLQSLFRKYKYDHAIIFGHALEGNLHFVFNQDFNSLREILRYKDFISDLTKLVVNKYDGSLKAEHGTGRNMAPFVELEWGNEAYLIMKEIKKVFDPDELLNPGVILNNDKEAHIKSLKPLPPANEIIDKCIECGFCEIRCPSRNLSLTPRQRIVIFREIERLKPLAQSNERLKNLVKQYDYEGNQTCATDGLCALDCPVGIDTGKLIKEYRFNINSNIAKKIASLISNNFSLVTGAMKTGLNLVNFSHSLFGTKFMEVVSSILTRLTKGKIPGWTRYMPKGADSIVLGKSFLRETDKLNELPVVYFPSCINRTMGISSDYKEKDSLTSRTQSLLYKAGCRILFPENLSNLCCGMAFDSKGFKEDGMKKAKELELALLKVSEDGRHPILVDMSPCLYRMKQILDKRLKLYEPVEFILKYLKDRLEFHQTDEVISIHSTCSSIKMELSGNFLELARLCSSNVIVPRGVECCGWAGDRGFTYPELNKSALSKLKEGIPENCNRGFSTSRTCEIGLSLHSGINYESIIYLVDECTTAKTIG